MQSESNSDLTTNQVNNPMNRNPTGKGGFADNPQNRSDGRWSKDNSFTYHMNRFKNMSVADFKIYEKETPEEARTVAESIAFAQVSKARQSITHFREVADRTEGKPKQIVEQTIITPKEIQDLFPPIDDDAIPGEFKTSDQV